jgi:hypothetical protein
LNWIEFFQSRSIDYAASGPNVSKGQIAIKCPWCGISDEGHHLSISLAGRGFKCWRQPVHAGKNPARLIQALLGCSWEQASSIAGNAKTLPNDFINKVKTSLMKQEVQQPVNKLKLPVEFRPFSKMPSCRPYMTYINSRGFTIKDADEYGVYYASMGLYKGRVIFTVEYEGKLVGWTGRTIFSSQNARYKTLTNDTEKAEEQGEIPAPAPISDYLLFYDRLVHQTADTIVLCEGPMDCWKVNILGKYLGVVATCFFTSTMSKQQLNLLHSLLPKFKNKYLLLDEGTFSKSARMRSDLFALDVVVKRMPVGIKDPALFSTVSQLREVLG